MCFKLLQVVSSYMDRTLLTSRITLGKESDANISDDEAAIRVSDISKEGSVYGIMLELVRSVGQIQERIVHSDHSRLGVFERSTHHQAADTTESVDTDFSWFHDES
jgi:hypothetical protein